MDWKLTLATFTTIFVAELGDKTQVATIALASQSKSTLSILIGVVVALALAGIIGVFAGRLFAQFINPQILKYTAGSLLIVMGIWMFVR